MEKTVTSAELKRRIRALRASLDLSQKEFSEKLKVARPQVSRWEKGTEGPSNEKLIALGNIAPLSVGLWFWRRAGLDTQRVEEAVLQELARLPDETTLAKTVRIPRLDGAALLLQIGGGEKGPAVDASDSIPLPALFVPDQTSTVCIQVPEWAKGPLLFAGDLALVRRTPAPLPNLLDHLVAVLFEVRHNIQLPTAKAARSYARGPSLSPKELEAQRDELERWEESDRATNPYLAEATAPGVLFGILRVGSDGKWDKKLQTLGIEHPWRLFLECGDSWEPLTRWSGEAFPSERSSAPELMDGVHIEGPVITWISASNETSEEAIEGADISRDDE